MTRHTKIVATLGPSTEEKSKILSLVEAGMNIARLNFSHGSYAQFKKIVKNIRDVEHRSGKVVGILQDLQGPKIRLGEVHKGLTLGRGETLTFSSKLGEKNTIHLPYPPLPHVVKPGQLLLIDDGLIRTKILSIKGHHVKVEILHGGLLQSHKGVNIPDSKLLSSQSLNAKDQADLKFGIQVLKVDAVALSFVETADDVQHLRATIKKLTSRPIHIIAKIERPKALKNLSKIIEAADGIMIARGDLGIEIEAERVPVEQKRILVLCREVGKPVIIATQILQSMVSNPLATRAEISDAATAIFDHADAFMLSNETAVGKYPERAVHTLAKVAQVTEEAIFKNRELYPVPYSKNRQILEDETLALGACMVADQIDAEALVILSQHGFTVSQVVKHRPKNRIVVVTNNKETARWLHFFWGVHAVYDMKGPLRSEETVRILQKKGALHAKSQVVVLKLTDQKRSLVMMKL